MSDIQVYLGSRATVDSNGDFNFRNAMLLKDGSEIVNRKMLSDEIAIIDSNIAFIKSNVDAEHIDSLSEILSNAQSLDFNLKTLISDEVNAREQAVSAERDARVLAVSTEQSEREQAVLAEQTARQLEDANLKSLSLQLPVFMSHSIQTIPDEKPPIPQQVAGLAYNYDGWYFKNKILGEKINWYLPLSQGLKMKDVSRIYSSLLIINKVSLPWITIYTKAKQYVEGSLSLNKSSWYNSRYNYLVKDSSSIVSETSYRYMLGLKPNSAVLAVPKDHVSALLEQGGNTLVSDDASDEDEILAIAINTNSSSSAENVKFILKDIQIQTPIGVYPFYFSNSVVFEKYSTSKMNSMFQYFFNTDFTNDTFVVPVRTPFV